MGRWNTFGLQFLCSLVLILGSRLPASSSLNLEGFNLLKFRERVAHDPYNSLASWDPDDNDPCAWLGVGCVDGKVQMLDLHGLSLGGTLAPELGNLGDLRVLVLHGNRFSGAIPREFGLLEKLELLDLRDNHLSGTIPAEIANIISFKRLLLCDNNFEGSVPPEIWELGLLSELQLDKNVASVALHANGCTSRKFGNGRKTTSDSSHGQVDNLAVNLESSYKLNVDQNVHNAPSFARRKLLGDATNLEARAPAKPKNVASQSSQPTSRSSGSFSAIVSKKSPLAPSPSPASSSLQVNASQPVSQSPSGSKASSQKIWIYVAVGLGVALLLVVAMVLFFICRSRGVTTIGPFKTGISGQLQKAFVTGVPKLNRPELETACEDFSNIIDALDGCTIYKGTLSSGVEIAVASTTVTSAKDWTEEAELAYRKKIETLSRVNHKNFVNLLGYCEEEEPFTRMMVFEYAPSGSLFEHLHVKDLEHLEWNARVRIMMGTCYCLQYMHHDLNRPVSHTNLSSAVISLTDDYAAKLAEMPFLKEATTKAKESVEGKRKHSQSPATDTEINVYDFGVLLLEIVSGRLPYSEELGLLVDWASKYLKDKASFEKLIDPTLKSVKKEELEIIREVIQECIRPDPKWRPTMREVTSKLREVIAIAPDAAVPRLSPLWWAELEILSVEAA